MALIASVPARMAVCRICSGELELHVRGTAAAPTAAAFSPSSHLVGQHADLLRCLECATVQQPTLPNGDKLAIATDDFYNARDALS